MAQPGVLCNKIPSIFNNYISLGCQLYSYINTFCTLNHPAFFGTNLCLNTEIWLVICNGKKEGECAVDVQYQVPSGKGLIKQSL
jgi:hypothetical protein